VRKKGEEKKDRKKPQGKNIMSASAMQGSHNNNFIHQPLITAGKKNVHEEQSSDDTATTNLNTVERHFDDRHKSIFHGLSTHTHTDTHITCPVRVLLPSTSFRL